MKLWRAVTGNGAPFVLCHGGPGMWDYLGPLAARIDDIATVVRYDQRGGGRSQHVGPYSIQRFVADLEELREQLGYDRWIVGGHSWGATLALQYALAHPQRTRGVVYISGVGLGRAWHAAFHAEADRRRTTAERERLATLDALDLRTPDEEREYRTLSWIPDLADRNRVDLLAPLIDAPFSINREANRLIGAEMKAWDESEQSARASRCAAAVLIEHGELDPRPHWAIDSLAAALPEVTVHKLPGVGHSPWLEDSDATVAPIRAFIASL